ncbi:Hypothetical predicted protein [Paramuricea clavata]|uniref:Uncharacterized protein n=1 Tax=Paramuricea clavata TaxID=317549 RepID=A0A6S7IH87_PARCT|nr:Hypothetical predicted protein [Paramuricea clavata]
MDELSPVAEINDPDLICISETWLDPSILDLTISPYRKDRGTPGGGLITYVKTAIPSSRLFDMEEEGKEALWLLLKPQRLPRPFSCIVMVAVYYPPDQAAINETTMIDYLTNGIDVILQSYPSAGIIIAGDFNKMKLGTLCNCFDFRKIVKKPTRQNNTLGQIMTNMSPLFQEVQHLPPLDEVESLLKNYPLPLPSIGQIKSVLNHFNHSKTTGTDGVPAWLLKRFSSDLAPIVHDIITASIKQCKYPSHYKHGLVTSVPKAYPPTDWPLYYIGSDSITQTWFNATDNTCRDKAGIRALFIDFKKAFDLVDHGILLNKLVLMNVNKSFWLWVKSFLSGRTQQVKINQTLSSIEGCPAGVPQGSALSPTLFNIHIDDLDTSVPEDLEVSTYKYADDCTQSECIMKGECSNMQKVLDSVQN